MIQISKDYWLTLDSPAYSFRMKRLERLSDDLDRMRESIYHSEKTGSDAFL
ncbi:SPP1 family phage head morphogenesis domain protein [Streptococcus pneumoniae EU-NP01]|nr:SPP1 family phage head morphogenesis domain protein [Streptococcus pneumoniae EU-NP01]